MDIQAFITIIIITGIVLTAYSLKLQSDREMVIFADSFDIAIASGMFLFPSIAFVISHNTALTFCLFVIPLFASFKISLTNNPDNTLYALLSFISKLTIVSTVVLILILLCFALGTKHKYRESL
jgi:hypothetical protein